MAFQVEAPFLMQELFWKGYLLVKGLFMSFLSKERIMAQKCSREMDNFFFGQRAPRYQSRMILKYYGLVTCIFGYWKGVGRFEAVASLNAYQITKYQVLQKLIIFCFLVSEEFEKEILKSGIFLPIV